MEINEDEKYYVQTGMETYGGSFVKALGQCVARADPQNLAKIKETWPKYWEEYLQHGERLYNQEEK